MSTLDAAGVSPDLTAFAGMGVGGFAGGQENAKCLLAGLAPAHPYSAGNLHSPASSYQRLAWIDMTGLSCIHIEGT